MLLNHLSLATEAAPKWAKAWHNWALYNVNAMEHYAQRNVEQAQRHVAPAVLGFFRSVALAQAQGDLGMTCCAGVHISIAPSYVECMTGQAAGVAWDFGCAGHFLLRGSGPCTRWGGYEMVGARGGKGNESGYP